MYHREVTITPTQQAANGALDIFVEGCRRDDVRQMLFGLSVLSSSTEGQVKEAMQFVQAHGRGTVLEIEGMLVR